MDDATIAAARLGERSAQAALLQALQDPWYRFCLSLLGDPEQAQEAVQETALRFLSNLSGFRGKSQLKTWSFGIAVNVVREMRRARRSASLSENETEAPDESVASPDFAAGNAEETATLRSVLSQLPDRQREAIVLRFLEQMSVEQTATLMQCATGTVKATVHQALRALRDKLGVLI